MKTQYSTPVRIGMLALPMFGILSIVGILLRGPLSDASVNPQAFAQSAAAPGFAVAWQIIILSEVFALLGYLALYAALTPGRLSLWALVLTIVGTALFLSLTGFMAFAAPVVGRLYLQGQTNVIQVAVAGFFAGPVLSFLYPAGLLGGIGSILFAIAIWRSSTLLKWSAIPFALAIILLAFAPAFSYAVEMLGAVCALVSGAWLAWGVFKPASVERPRLLLCQGATHLGGAWHLRDCSPSKIPIQPWRNKSI
jgi:hypothetical protein